MILKVKIIMVVWYQARCFNVLWKEHCEYWMFRRMRCRLLLKSPNSYLITTCYTGPVAAGIPRARKVTERWPSYGHSDKIQVLISRWRKIICSLSSMFFMEERARERRA